MRRLNINNIQVDTTLKKNVIIKNSLQLPEEFRGNLKNSMICPITYNNLSDNVIYYDGDEYTITGGTIQKNGNNIFTVSPTHLAMTEHASALDRNSDNGAVKTGSVINYSFNKNGKSIAAFTKAIKGGNWTSKMIANSVNELIEEAKEIKDI